MVMAGRRVPHRGDVTWVDFDPQVGREQAGRRPALVMSTRDYNERSGLAVFCPITNRVRGNPFEVVIPPGLPVTGVILADQVKSQDWRGRNAAIMTTLPAVIIDEVLDKIGRLLLVS